MACLFAALVASTAGAAAEDSSPTLREIAAGTWGFDVEGASCDDNPHTIEFSDDGLEMLLSYSKGVGGEPPLVARYRFLGEGPGFLRMAIERETRTTDEGEPVEWDLVLLTPNAYCWHRTDWQEGGCTQPARRCGEAFVLPR